MRSLAFCVILSDFSLTTTANILNGTVTELLWPQMRSSVANYLVKNNILTGPDAYSQVFAKIPDSGNCWCNANKHETSKGMPQDLYDVACKKYHYCIRCGYNSNITDFDENVVVSFDQKEASSSFNVSGGLVGIVESNNVLNFDAGSNSVEIYEWECEENQSEAGMAVCKGFKQLENDFINVFLSEIELAGSYNQECSSGAGGDCPDCPVTQAPVADVAEFEELLNWVPPDSCCGVSPTWRSYYSKNGENACCGTEIYNTILYDCCNIETSELQLSGECNIPCSTDPCGNDGECTNSLDFESYICTCTSEFTGTDCEIESPCATDPCSNSGVCTKSADFSSYTCECTEEFTGTNCEIESPCSTDPCLNSGVCTKSVDFTDYTCACTDEFTGTNCEIDSPCTALPCFNNGVCTKSADFSSYTCGCTEEFTGTDCETESPCSTDPCLNFGVCTKSTDFTSYTCDCTEEFTGTNCETDSPCTALPCFNNGTCTKSTDFTTYTCTCDSDFTGTDCETEKPCTTAICENSGTCVDSTDFATFTCDCTSSFTGTNCETPKPCETSLSTETCNTGECINSEDYTDFTCDCGTALTGSSCNITIPCEAETNLCWNSGTCVNAEDYSGHFCICQDDWAGASCQLSITPFKTSYEVYVWGDPHYHTFDGPRLDPQGTCAYTATKLCDNSSVIVGAEEEKYLPFFEVVADHNWNPSGWGYPRVTFVHGIEIFYRLAGSSDTYHFRIHRSIDDCQAVYLSVNGGDYITLRSGENIESQGLATRKKGRYHEIYLGVGFQLGDTDWLANTATKISDFILKVRFKKFQLYLEASELLKSKVCGLFGNWNGDSTDVERPDGVSKRDQEAALMAEYIYPEADVVETWDFVTGSFECSDPVEYEDCSEEDELVYRAICEELNESPFTNCDLDREEIIDHCVFDLCVGIPESDVVCEMMENYVSRCNANGASQNYVTGWRSEDRCPLACDANMSYDSCAKTACQATTNYCSVNATTCAASVDCNEGCFCDEGWLLADDGTCTQTCNDAPIISLLPYSCPNGATLFNPAESTRSYSTVWSNNPIGTGHARSMIDSEQGWSAKSNTVGQWMVIDLESSLAVAGLAIQGRLNYQQQWVTGFTVQYWLDGETSADAKNIDENIQFTVPEKLNEMGMYNEIYFGTGVVARYFQITVQTWDQHISMRAGVLMCN